jgi:hypothetical protein
MIGSCYFGLGDTNTNSGFVSNLTNCLFFDTNGKVVNNSNADQSFQATNNDVKLECKYKKKTIVITINKKKHEFKNLKIPEEYYYIFCVPQRTGYDNITIKK